MQLPRGEEEIERAKNVPKSCCCTKDSQQQEWIFLMCPMLWAKKSQIWEQEESLHIHLDTAAWGFEHI